MKLGRERLEALRAEIIGELHAGEELIVTHWIARRGTALAVSARYAELQNYFSDGFLRDALKLGENLGMDEECRLALKGGASAVFPLGEGGILAGLWKMAEAGGVGLSVYLRKIPIRQETIEVCERLDINPYQLQSQGSLLIGAIHGDLLVQELQNHGIPAAVIGHARKGNDRLLYNQENIRYLDRPKRDEIYKILTYQASLLL